MRTRSSSSLSSASSRLDSISTSGAATSRHRHRRSPLIIFLAAAIGILGISNLSPCDAASSSSFPDIDFDALGSVGVAGSFAGIDIWTSSGSASSNSYDADASTLLQRSENGTLTDLNATEAGGVISAVCGRPTSTGTIIAGGTFSEMGNVATGNIAAYNPVTGVWDHMDGGLDGTVSALLCLDDVVVVGGDFTGPAAADHSTLAQKNYLGNVALWNFSTNAWQAVDFGGLNGTVRTIMSGANSSVVQFGGSFDTAFSSGNVSSTASTNATAISGTLTSSTALSAKWAPISLAMSHFQGGPTLDDSNFNMVPQILCPQGADGPGNTYLFSDGSAGSLSVEFFRRERVRAFRLGNTFYNGRGTQNFSITSLPDGDEIELLYLDPTTNRNVTCTTQCQLYQNASVPYQDFLINNASSSTTVNGTMSITGFTLHATSWYGAGAGLHILEVLSAGGFSSAYGAYNRGACNSPEAGVNGTGSDVSFSGGWYHTALATDISGVREGVLQLSDRYSNLNSHSAARVSFQVDLAVRGNYTGYLHVPGCSRAGQCNDRTDVLVTVINNSTNSGTSVTVSQNVQDDTDILIWDGEVDATSETFMPSVVLSIPSGATEPSSGDFTVVADRVRFVLRNSNETYQSNISVVQRGFGVFSYDVIDAEQQALTSVDATGIVPNSSLTDLTAFGVTLLNAGVTRSANEEVFALATIGDSTFIGGVFASDEFSSTSGFKNIVGFNNQQDASQNVTYSRLATGGLNGTVRAMYSVQDTYLFVGGDFTGSADSSSDLAYIARYEPSTDQWAALADGPNGPVSSLATLGDDALLVAGNFTMLGSSTTVPGYAVWNTTNSTWVTEESLIVGSISSISAANGTAYLVGAISAVSANAAPGAVALDPPTSGNIPLIKALDFAFAANSSSKLSSSVQRRSSLMKQGGIALGAASTPRSLAKKWTEGHRRFSLPRRLFTYLFRRRGNSSIASGSLVRRADAIQPASLQDNSDHQILASAFWERSDGVTLTIIGGQFTSTGGVSNLGIFDQSATVLNAFPTYPSENGSLPTIFRALAVDDDTLFAGGDGGLVVFDLKSNSWISSGQVLSSSSNRNLTVSAIAHRPDNTQIIVAGDFDAAGLLPCVNVCLWDTSSQRWNVLGNGVDGKISAIDYAGTAASNLVVAGEMTVDSESSSLQRWDFNAQNWTAIGSVGTGSGQLPGPATAVSVDDLNLDAIFVAGRYADGSAPYLAKWDGTTYQLLGSDELQASTGIAQLTFVPITEAHDSNDVLEENRLLVVSGALSLKSYGNISSAFFDGANWTPFLRSTSTSGGPGIIRAFSRSTEVLKFPNLHHLAVGLVILISIAIGLGIVFLLVLIGLLVALARRRPNRGVDVPISPSDELLASEKKRPTSLLATLNAATENVMGAGAAGVGFGAMTTTAGGTSSSGHYRGDSVPLTSEGHNYYEPSSQYHSEAQIGRSAYYSDEASTEAHTAMSLGTTAAVGAIAGTSSRGAGGAGAITSSDDAEGVDAHMRFSFEATHPSELGVRAGDSVTILDDADEHWWLARSDDGRIGVVPASYVL